MANEKQVEQEESLPLLEGTEADAFQVELPVDGGRTLSCTVRRRPGNASCERQTVQVLLSFKDPFFGECAASKELLLHW